LKGTLDIARLTNELAELAVSAGRRHSVAVVLPLRDGMRDVAAEFLVEGPPFDPEKLKLTHHQVFLTDREIVFVFETEKGVATLAEIVAEPEFWTMASAWEHVMADQPRIGSTIYQWAGPGVDEHDDLGG
jgi:hypothetical protein